MTAPAATPAKLPLCAVLTCGGYIYILFANIPVSSCPANLISTADCGLVVPIPTELSVALEVTALISTPLSIVEV